MLSPISLRGTRFEDRITCIQVSSDDHLVVAGHTKGKLDENVTWYFDLVNVAMVLRVWMVLVFDADFCWEFFFWGGFAVVAMFARKPLGGRR